MEERLPRPGDVVDGKYKVEGLLGRGGMGAVYRAQHRITHRRVALKYLLANDEAMRMRFIREARAMGALEHPNVVGILDVGEHEGAVYMVMQYIEGVSLKEHLDKQPIEPTEAVRLIMPALEGIAAAHQAGIVHRDLKPANLLVCLDRDGTPFDTKVLDFGVAFTLRKADQSSDLTRSGAVVGTPRYMAPEQIRGDRGVDERSDQFAVGLILYEMLTGRLPYEAGAYEALVIEIATMDPAPPRLFRPDLSRELSDIVEKTLAKQPEDRFHDIAALARALEPFGEDVAFHPPRRAHARHSLMGEDIVELAAASASLTPDPSESGGVASTLDAPERASEPPTRQLGAKPGGEPWFEAPTELPVPRFEAPELPIRAGSPPPPGTTASVAMSAPDQSPTRQKLWPVILFAAALAIGGVSLYVLFAGGEPEPVASPPTAPADEPTLPEGEAPPPQLAAPPAPLAAAPPVAESPSPEPAAEATAPASEAAPEPRSSRRAHRSRRSDSRTKRSATMMEATRAVGRSGSFGVEEF